MKRTLLVYILITACIQLYPQNMNNINELIMSGNYSEAAALLNEAAAADSLNSDIYRKVAYCYSSVEDYDNAISSLQKALLLKPDDSRILLMLGDSYTACEKYNEAKSAYIKYLEQNINNTSGQLKLAKTFIALKEWAAGESILKKLAENENTVAVYYELLARCQETLKENDDAIVSLHKAVKLNPAGINNIIKLCNLYFRTDRPKSAQVIAEAGLLSNPNNGDLWRVKAEAQFKMDYYKEAIESYKAARLYGDTTSTLYRNLGICYYASGSSDSAVFFLDTSLTIKGDDYITALYCGIVQSDLDSLDIAEEYFKLVEKIQMNEYVIESFINLGGIYQKRQNYKESVKFFSRALELDPQRKSVLFRMASTYDEGYEDKSLALKYYKEYAGDTLKTDPNMYKYAVKRINEIQKIP